MVLEKYTPKNDWEGNENPDLNLQLVENHYEPLIADTSNHPVKEIYEYPMLPQSLYDGVKVIPMELNCLMRIQNWTLKANLLL